MRRPKLKILVAVFSLGACSQPAQLESVDTRNGALPWQRHCTLDEISVDDDAHRKHLNKMAQACKPMDACILACMRESCATEIKGGCYHACSSEVSERTSGSAAELFETGADPTCGPRP